MLRSATSPAPASWWVSASQSIGEGICSTRGAAEVLDTAVASSTALEAVVSLDSMVFSANPVRDFADIAALRPSLVVTALA